MSLRALFTSILVATCFAIVAPTIASAGATTLQDSNPCTFCYVNPYTGELTCFHGVSIGDTNCQCFANTCALV